MPANMPVLYYYEVDRIGSQLFVMSKWQPKQIDLTYFSMLRCVGMEMKQMADPEDRGIQGVYKKLHFHGSEEAKGGILESPLSRNE